MYLAFLDPRDSASRVMLTSRYWSHAGGMRQDLIAKLIDLQITRRVSWRRWGIPADSILWSYKYSQSAQPVSAYSETCHTKSKFICTGALPKVHACHQMPTKLIVHGESEIRGDYSCALPFPESVQTFDTLFQVQGGAAERFRISFQLLQQFESAMLAQRHHRSVMKRFLV